MKKETLRGLARLNPCLGISCIYTSLKRISIGLALVVLGYSSEAQTQNNTSKAVELSNPQASTSEWHDKIAIRGYAQVRYNQLFVTNPDLGCEQCDKSWSPNESFFFRRIRIVFYGKIHPRVFFYIQPDFASSGGGGKLNFAQLKDAYMDVGLDRNNEFRFRIGQSKVPYGFENLQSSQNRLPLDRNDGMNSAVYNERDLGVFFMYAPKEKRKLFSDIGKRGLKGSGDYGVFALGVYNGQTANLNDLNNQVHVVSRISYPFEWKEQLVEMGVQAYTGNYVLLENNLSPGVKVNTDRSYRDERIAGSFILYPQPFGIAAEYNWGSGPEFNPQTDSIEVQKLHGGYITLSYLIRSHKQVIIPFTRYHYYDGGKKHELDARSYEVSELELGIEWQPFRQFELVAMYVFSQRRYEDFLLQDNLQEGSLLRLQAQVNF